MGKSIMEQLKDALDRMRGKQPASSPTSPGDDPSPVAPTSTGDDAFPSSPTSPGDDYPAR